MEDILAKRNRHLFLEEKDNTHNSFISNINYAVENINTIKTFNDNVNNGTMQHLLETYIEQVGIEGNAWVIRLTELGESILATTSGFNYAAVLTVNQDINAGATILLPEAMKYRVGTHMLLVSWNGTVCYNGEQYEEVGAFNERSAVIKTKQDIKAGDKLEFRTVALADTASINLTLGDAITSYTFPINNSNTQRTLIERFSDLINIKDFGAKGDGETDDTLAIKAAIEAAPENAAVIFPHGVYLTSSQIAVETDGLKLLSYGAEIRPYDPAVDHIYFLLNADTVVVDGFAFYGTTSGNKAVDVKSGMNCTVSRNYFNGCSRAVTIGYPLESESYTYKCHVVDNVIIGCTDIAICMSRARFPLIESNKIRDSTLEHITVDNYTFNAQIVNNLMQGRCGGTGAIGIDDGSNSTICNNYIFVATNLPALAFNGKVESSNYCIVTGNYFESNYVSSTYAAIAMYGATGDSSGRIHGSNKCIIKNNILRNFKYGVYFYSLSANNILGENQYINISTSEYVDVGENNILGPAGSVFPSSNHVNLSFPDDTTTNGYGGEITASATGWVGMIYKPMAQDPESVQTPNSTGWLMLKNATTEIASGLYVDVYETSFRYVAYIPVRKGDTINLVYPILPSSDSVLFFARSSGISV